MMAGVRNNALAHLQQLSRVKVRARPAQLAPLITSVPLLLLFTPPGSDVAPLALLHDASLYRSMACHA